MASRALPKKEWQTYFDRLSRGLSGKRAHVEVAGLALGDQVAARWLPLFGITYNVKDDLLEIAMEGFDHLIRKPKDIFVQDGPGGLASMEIIDSEGRRQIVKLRGPIVPSAPESGPAAA